MKLEAKAFLLVIVVAAFMFLGTYFTMIVPLMDRSLYTPTKDAKPYTALELRGKRIYEREGCMYCHTQQVRNLLEETQRYGMGEEETFKRFGIRALIQAPPSQPGEYVYDQPHLLGTRRVGPDLARVGGKYDNTWHLNHFRDPRSTSPGSLMPAYTWLYDKAGQPTDEAIALVAYIQKLGTNYRWREEGVEQARALQAKRAPAPPPGESVPATTPKENAQ
ncbi:MAG TPA: cbb3-type cytochrome c oxidase subunit II [Bacteroidota bacterium]|nr:cbb3-type cytochrome c oxidase subunit II [Bacteroidota bacterium]